MIARRPLSHRRPVRRAPYWTRDRVIVGLQRYYRVHGTAPTASNVWQAVTWDDHRRPPYRPYPCFSNVLRYFRTFRQAWIAAGIRTDRQHEDFTPEEHWYLREACGIIPRTEMARDLQRTPAAVHKYLQMHGLHSYLNCGWSLNRVMALTGVSRYWLDWCHERGLLPYRRGSKCVFIQPLDLLNVPMVDWEAHPEIGRGLRRMLLERLVGVLARMEAR